MWFFDRTLPFKISLLVRIERFKLREKMLKPGIEPRSFVYRVNALPFKLTVLTTSEHFTFRRDEKWAHKNACWLAILKHFHFLSCEKITFSSLDSTMPKFTNYTNVCAVAYVIKNNCTFCVPCLRKKKKHAIQISIKSISDTFWSRSKEKYTIMSCSFWKQTD